MRKFFLAVIIVLINISCFSQVQQAWVNNNIGDFFDDPGDPALVLDNNENTIVGLNTRVPDYESDVLGTQLSTFHISKFRPDGTEVFGILESVSSSLQKHLMEVAVDHAGNIYCAVRESWTVDPVHAVIGGRFAVYKYSPSGSVLWRRNYSDGQVSFARGIALDPAGNVYLTGFCLASGAQVTDELPDYLTVKWNTNGDFQWARRYDGASPGEGYNVANDIVVDGSGNVYITGASQRDGLIGYATLKYNTGGTLLWAQRYTGTGSDDDRAAAIAIDISGFVYVTGKSEGTMATIKYNNDGAQLWVQRKGSGAADGNRVKVDAFGNVYVLGNTSSTQAALVKYRFDGTELWTAAQSGDLYSLALDTGGNPYVAGTNSSGKGLAQKYANTGGSLWSQIYTSVGNVGIANPIAVAPDDNVYVISFSWLFCSGCGTPRYVASLNKYTQCTLVPPANITVNNDPGKCYAVVNFNPPSSTGDCGSTFTYSKDPGSEFPIGTTTVTATSDATGASCSFTITVIDNQPPSITCPANKTVNTDVGACYASAGSVNTGFPSVSDNCSGSFVGIRSDGLSLGANYNIGVTTITWTARDASNNTASCTQTITVVDNEPPQAICKNITVALDSNGAAGISAADVDNGSNDPCGIKGLSINKTSFGCGDLGPNTVTLTVTDNHDNTSTCNATVTIIDTIKPVISNISLSTYALTPPDLKMKNVVVNYSLFDNCPGTTAQLSVTSDEPESGLSPADKSPDWMVMDNHNVQLRAQRDPRGDGRVYTITITASDASGNISTATQTVVVAHNITGPRSGATVKLGTTVSLSGTFWDVPGNKHTGKWMIDGNTVKATVTEPSGMKNGTVSGSYKFTAPGVYKIQMNITDQNGVTTSTTTNGDLEAIIVVYDPNGGYTYGGGYFASPAGALKSDLTVSGDVSYGYTINYYKNATFPKGETQFEFGLGEFEFNAVNFDYLSISGAKAQFKGTGKIVGGQSGINFIATVIDGDIDGTGVDKLRMKIYNKNTGEVYYDNQPGAGDADDPLTPVGLNSLITISSNTASTITARIQPGEPTIPDPVFDVSAYPNPTSAGFNVKLTNSNRTEKILMRVTDAYGRTIETRTIVSTQNITFGQLYRPGVYYLTIMQGGQHREIKLIKLVD